MNIKYEVGFKGYTYKVTADEPNECPCCKHSLKPSILYKQLELDNNKFQFYVVYLCTNCYLPFVCRFSNLEKATNENYSFNAKTLDFKAPNIFQKKNFEDYINDLSPDFINIYNQSLEAEHLNLDQIAGIGYRKALEFLIKDFLIKHEHKDENKVKSTALGCCIDTMINNPQLKATASRATWLGNDQTHYEQKYTNNDVDDLKRLITLSVHWITMIYLTDEAEFIEKK